MSLCSAVSVGSTSCLDRYRAACRNHPDEEVFDLLKGPFFTGAKILTVNALLQRAQVFSSK